MSSTALLYALLSGIVPSFIWLWFWIQEDKSQPEPHWLLISCFLGGILAVILAVFAEKYIATLYSDPTIRYTLWAAVEEIFKFLAVAFIALKSKSFDEPIDAMIYCIVTALGFAALENALFIMGPLSDGLVAKALVTGNMRFIGATLLHVVSSATVGFALGYVFYKGIATKIFAVVIGLAGSIAIHAGFNLSIINAGSTDTLRTFSWIWGAVVILLILFEEVKVVRPKVW